ncbi:tRNA epoxyqueuosine(34) reductase QueG [bacterium]|nr:MAG: tRNA epoxyqueuosine(34) reductase QueG [bacterium]
MTKTDLTYSIKSKALEIGFDKVGIAKADKVASTSLLERWLTSGFHGTMKWMENYFDKRADPRKLFPGAKSVVSVALNYYTPQPIPNDPEMGKISRYAWGDDYHDIVKEKLRQLLNEIQSLCPDAEGKSCVDTSPMMDKYWATQAGIGWQGKNSNVITKELGSWVFLGEIILNVELDYDESISDFCGTCNRCIDACPTQAITEPYVVDSNKCISYLTIEYRGEAFPEQVAQPFNNWIYGCDICQDVCPWNIKFAETTANEQFFPRQNNLNRNVKEWESLSEDEFNNRFKKSPVKRTKYTGFVRNVKHVLSQLTKL